MNGMKCINEEIFLIGPEWLLQDSIKLKNRLGPNYEGFWKSEPRWAKINRHIVDESNNYYISEDQFGVM